MSHSQLCVISLLAQVYSYENADGIGKSFDLVLQGFTRFTAMATAPVVVCAVILYLLVSNCRLQMYKSKYVYRDVQNFNRGSQDNSF